MKLPKNTLQNYVNGAKTLAKQAYISSRKKY